MQMIAMADTNNNNAGTWNKIGSDDNENEIIVQSLVRKSINNLSTAVNESASSVDLKENLKKMFDSALKEYLSYRDSDQPRQWQKYKGVLIADLKIAFRDFCLNVSKKKSEKFSKVIESFRSQVDALIESKCQRNENLQNILSGVNASILQQFEKCPGSEIEHLKNRLDEESLLYITENEKRLSQLEKQFDSIKDDLIEEYQYIVELVLSDADLETASDEKLESAFQKCQSGVFKKFNKIMIFENQETKELFENQLIAILREQFSTKINASIAHKNKQLTEAATIVTVAVEKFTCSMSAIFARNSDESAIHTLHNEKCKDSLMLLTEKLYEILRDPSAAKQMVEIAKQKMESIFQEMKTERKLQLQKFHEQWEAELSNICGEFSIRFHEVMQSQILPEIDELQENREILINELIREHNTPWLNERIDREDLRKDFNKKVKERIKNASIPILVSCAQMLANIYEEQKLLMNQCLETHELQINGLLKGDVNDETIAKAKNVGVRSVEQFDNQIRKIIPSSASATTKLRGELKQRISEIQNKFEKQVQDRKLIVISEISQLVEDTVTDYKHLMNSLSIATNYSTEKMAPIHDNLKDRAQDSLKKNLKLAKYSGNHTEQQRKLDVMIDRSYNDIKWTIDNQQAEWNKTLESCSKKATIHYKQQFSSSMALISNDEELQKLHENLKGQAIAIWEETFPIHYFGAMLYPERSKFAKSLDNDFKNNIHQMWQEINLGIDRKTKAAVEKLVEKYKNEVTSTLNQFDFVSNDIISSIHEKLSQEAKQSLNRVDKPRNISKETYDDLLSSRLLNTLESFKINNNQKKETIQNDLSKQLHLLKDNIRKEILDLKVLPEMSALLKTYWDRVEQLLNHDKTPVDCLEEIKSFATEKLKEILSVLETEWCETEPDSSELELSINKAVNEYNKEMDNRTSTKGQIFVSSAMKTHHEYALALVKKQFQLRTKQTSAVRETFNKAIEEIRKKFEDLNDLRAAEFSDAAIGIDLGTTFSCVAIYKGGKIEMIPDRDEYKSTVPSYVYYETASKTVVGKSAKDLSIIHPQNTIFDSKRLIGRKFDDSQTQKDITQWPFKVVQDPNPNRNAPKIEVHGKTFHPEEVSGEILKYLKSNAEWYLRREVKNVVITVPAYFNDAQKRATKNAATFANINVLEIINEPTSAAIAYSLNYSDGKSKNILVFDLGGGTFDVSVLSSEKCNIVVKAVGGDNHLGGEDFDSNMVDFCIEKFHQETGIVISKNVSQSSTDKIQQNETVHVQALRRLRQKCEQEKISLSKTDKVHVRLDYIIEQNDLDIEVTVQDFNEMNKLLFNKCIQVVKNTLEESKLTTEQIDDVVLVGGSSRIPEIQRLLSEFFNEKSLTMTLNPDEVVAQGAAYRAAMISGSNSRELAGIKFQDVNPLSYGIAVVDEKFSVILPKNTPLPAKRTETFYTVEDYQTEIIVSIYEGEDTELKNNNLLGEFSLSNIPSKKRGEEPVDVTIECDGEGLIHVTAKARSSDNISDIKIHANRGDLTEEDILNAKSGVSVPSWQETASSLDVETGVLKVFPTNKGFIGRFAIQDVQNNADTSKLYQTIIILDRSGSMGSTVRRVTTRILPLFFSKLSYQDENLIYLITFESQTELHEKLVADFPSLDMSSTGCTYMEPAIHECKKVLEGLKTDKPIRILTISDGEICDQQPTSTAADGLKVFLENKSFLINSKAVRLFTSSSEPDTTALCSLLQINNAIPKSLVDIQVTNSDDYIATKMAELFMEDNFDKIQILKTTGTVLRRQPWNNSTSQLLYVPGVNNVWLSEVPKDGLMLDAVPLTVIMQNRMTKEQHKKLLDSNSDLIVETMKVLKVVNSKESNKTLQDMNKYFNTNIRGSTLTKKANTILNDKSVAGMSSSEKAVYLVRK